ncbi:MAG TPA: sigma-70 family RNA polymerase sigma factor [Anaerolineales bacterium]|nr:sigma-70 family RNA polymerase sigma factor [Anaerolineales bacterium]HMR99153.1 sigma-70 family RNA polymerase sigma factor [Anaerolineales bacterium]HNQ95675.1 sigma-70 family RNA polymerase sigma factor [Anaerolineales bacterium]HNS61123.1 sigma-70 family RNA polymerase sigma factor [Anaerolineales bacterium]
MKTYPDTETMLIATAQRGDLDAFNLLVLKYQDMMYRVSLRVTHNELSAEDATQNALIQAFNSLRSFRGGSFKSWLARVAINASYDELRREKRHIAMPLEQFNNEGEEIESPTWMMDLSAGPQELAESSEVQAALQRCIRALTPDYRLMVILVDIEGMSYEEAAQVTRVPVGTVKSRLARARMQLRSALKKFEDLLPSAYRVEIPSFSHA